MTDDGTEFEVTLRPALAKEQSLITKLVLENNLNPFGLNWQSFTVAADKDNRFIGCGQIKKHGNLDELASLVVIEEYQGRGVSTLLMEDLMERGGRPLWLMCESTLIPYYNGFGFHEVREPIKLPSYFQTTYWLTFSLSAILMVRGTYVAFMVLEE